MLYMHLVTNVAVFRAMRYIKKNDENAFRMGREFCSLFYIIYSEFKKNSMYAVHNAWDSINSFNGFDLMVVSEFVSRNVDFSKFFSKCNIKILQLSPDRLSSFFRGYYVNDLNLFSTNINENVDNTFIVLYDCHYHYLLFLFNYLFGKGIEIQLNDAADKYSINEDSDAMCYKLVFEKKNYDFIDPVKNLLNFLYTSVEDHYDCIGDDDKALFNKYITYCSTN